MKDDTAAQFSAVYAEAAIAFIETGIPQAVLWFEEDERWDFRPGDEDIEPSLVAFVLQQGWDGQLTLEAPTDADDEHYDSSALRDEIELQMMDEGIARAFIENLKEHRERQANGEYDDENDKESDDVEGDS